MIKLKEKQQQKNEDQRPAVRGGAFPYKMIPCPVRGNRSVKTRPGGEQIGLRCKREPEVKG